MKTLTTTNAVPKRINAEHYEIASESTGRLGKVYDLVFDPVVKRWICNCNDATKNHNPDCKHRRRLTAWIAEQEQSSLVQAQATQIAEQVEEPVIEVRITNSTLYGLMAAVVEAEGTIKRQGNRIECLEYDVRAMQQVHQAAMAQQDHHIELLERMLAQSFQQLALMQSQIVALENRKAERPTQTPRTPKAPTEEEMERMAWEEFERDPDAGRRKAEEKRRNAPLTNNNDFSLLKK